ncbi:MAG TPA: hypothetical protein VF972_07370 [Actinomycetota bacterium]
MFLKMYVETASIATAAEAAGIDRRTHYRWLRQDDAYRTAAEEAREFAADLLEAEARRRAVDGVEEPVIYQGKDTGIRIRRYSDTLLIFLLKGARPEVYRDRTVENRHTGPQGGPVVVEHGLLDREKATKVLQILHKAGVIGLEDSVGDEPEVAAG